MPLGRHRNEDGQESVSSVASALHDPMLILDCLPRAIVILDRDGTVMLWNRVATRFYGWTATEAVGSLLHDLVTPPELREVADAIMTDALTGITWSGDVKVRTRDGRTVVTFAFLGPLMDANGLVVGMVVAADDQSQLRDLSERASNLHDRLVLALSAGRLGTWQWDARSGATTWDLMMEQLFGLAEGSFDGTFDQWVACLHPEDRDEVLATLDHAVATGSDYEVEHRVLLADETTRWLNGRGKVLFDDNGEVIGTIGCTSDVTDRKLAESEAQRRVEEVEEMLGRERLQRQRLEFLTRLNDVAISASTPQELMKAVTETAIPQLGDWCSVHFMPEPGGALMTEIAHIDPAKVHWAREFRDRFPFDPAAPTGVPAVLRTRITEFTDWTEPSALHDLIEATGRPDREEMHEIADQLHLTSVITVPLLTRRGVIGAIQFVSAESGRRYTTDDVALAEAAAGRVAEALANAWLTTQQHDIATTLQAALLPPLIPVIDGVDIATRYWTAGALSDVGGDFYDVFPLGGDTWAIVVGDVCGTGPRAAAVTSIARHTIRAAATHGLDHIAVIDWVNDAILHSNKNTFCTVVYSTLQRTPTGGWRYTTAIGGHPRPVLVTHEGARRALGTYGTLVGMIEDIKVTVDTYDLAPGDTIVLYTDGVTDLRPPNGLTEEELIDLVGTNTTSDTNANGVAAALGRAIEGLVPINVRQDDVALLVARIEH